MCLLNLELSCQMCLVQMQHTVFSVWWVFVTSHAIVYLCVLHKGDTKLVPLIVSWALLIVICLQALKLISGTKIASFISLLSSIIHSIFSFPVLLTFLPPSLPLPSSLPLSLPGRTVRVVVALHLFSPLLRLAVEVGFDWVYYADPGYIRMSVVPDCKLLFNHSIVMS